MPRDWRCNLHRSEKSQVSTSSTNGRTAGRAILTALLPPVKAKGRIPTSPPPSMRAPSLQSLQKSMVRAQVVDYRGEPGESRVRWYIVWLQWLQVPRAALALMDSLRMSSQFAGKYHSSQQTLLTQNEVHIWLHYSIITAINVWDLNHCMCRRLQITVENSCGSLTEPQDQLKAGTVGCRQSAGCIGSPCH